MSKQQFKGASPGKWPPSRIAGSKRSRFTKATGNPPDAPAHDAGAKEKMEDLRDIKRKVTKGGGLPLRTYNNR
jgi:hypothetical protein